MTMEVPRPRTVVAHPCDAGSYGLTTLHVLNQWGGEPLYTRTVSIAHVSGASGFPKWSGVTYKERGLTRSLLFFNTTTKP